MERGGARGTARAPWPLRGVQPALRPRYGVRAEDRRQRGFDIVIDAAVGEVALSRRSSPIAFASDSVHPGETVASPQAEEARLREKRLLPQFCDADWDALRYLEQEGAGQYSKSPDVLVRSALRRS